MSNAYRGVYIKEIFKVTFISMFVLALLVCMLWSCLFITDYIMVKNNKPTVFTNSHVEQTENGKIVYEDGAFYHVVTNEKQERTFYLFNNKINLK